MIQVENLGMMYGRICALDSVNFQVKKGEVIGLLGPNGAGKSTTLKIITTYISPSFGNAYISGMNVCENPIAVRKLIGYLPEQLPLYMDMEISEYLSFVGKARGLYGEKLKSRLEWVKKKCGIESMYHKIIRELSKGYRQRTALAQAILHDPDIIILDEPTSGLDPHQIIEIRNLIQELANIGKTIIFSTHILQEVQAVTNRILILNRGELVADGNVIDLQNSIDYRQYLLTLSKEMKEEEVTETLKTIPNVEIVRVEHSMDNKETSYVIKNNTKDDILSNLAKLVQQKNWDFLELKRHQFSLEEVFLHLTRK